MPRAADTEIPIEETEAPVDYEGNDRPPDGAKADKRREEKDEPAPSSDRHTSAEPLSSGEG